MDIDQVHMLYKREELIRRCVKYGMSESNARDLPNPWLFLYFWEESHIRDDKYNKIFGRQLTDGRGTEAT